MDGWDAVRESAVSRTVILETQVRKEREREREWEKEQRREHVSLLRITMRPLCVDSMQIVLGC